MSRFDAEHQEILLETGTNEVEILEFLLRDQSFGVNVAKIKQIIQFDPERKSDIPESPAAMLGVYLYREGTIPLVSLAQALKMKGDGEQEKPLVLVCEFNGVVCGFLIDGVKRIHRLSWKDMQPLNQIMSQQQSCIISSVNINENEVLIVDMEHILVNMGLSDNHPEPEVIKDIDTPEQKDTLAKCNILIAEDSNFIRYQMIQNFKHYGFENILEFANGQDAYNKIKEIQHQCKEENRPLTDFIDFIITDIEMPKMDGLTLCRLVKEDLKIKNIPVAIYSSLINDQMVLKCQQVKADYHMCKPQVAELINLLSQQLLGKPISETAANPA
ncbi:MAG: chemotaxis signal transduction protein CheV [Spartobacteria bacterium]|nr:chemotaxis signal transduction protein CheV [Spartobacteria bacterium]